MTTPAPTAPPTTPTPGLRRDARAGPHPGGLACCHALIAARLQPVT